MKKTIILALLCLTAGIVAGQNKMQRKNAEIAFMPDKVSATTAMLYYGLKNDDSRLLKDFEFVNVNGQKSVAAFLMVADSNLSRLDQYGIALNGSKKGWIKSATIPLRTFAAFVESGMAQYIDAGIRGKIQNDSARYYTRADQVQRGGGSGITLPRGYCGKDVVVGIVDIGFDYTHRNFYDSTETVFRIKRVWDHNDSMGLPPVGYSYGSEYTTAQAIKAALYSHNYHSHGSHVAGIAGGGGTTDTSVSRYKGMAPESDLVFVATNGNSSMLYDGTEYIASYAQSVGKPCVINLSWGTQIGPHDGFDDFDISFDYLIDTLFTEGTIINVAASNNGYDSLHLSKTFTSVNSSLKTFVEPSGEDQFSGYVDMWGEAGQTISFRLFIFDTSRGVAVDSTIWYSSNGTSSTYAEFVENCAFYYFVTNSYYYNNKPNVMLYIDNTYEWDSNYRVLLEVKATQGTVHLWLFNRGRYSSLGYPWAQNGNTSYTLNAWGHSDNVLMVASYTSKIWWYPDNSPRPYHYLLSTPVGSRSFFSSIGPSLSNRLKPDVAAPGSVLISSYNYGDTVYPNDTLLVTHIIPNNGHNSYFGIMQGTSMATPAATGVIALWLEAYPYLTIDQVKEIIRTTSIADSATGPISANGSVEYGRGKIDALAGLQAILNKVPPKPVISPSSTVTICGNGTTTLTAPSGYTKYLWNTGDTTRSITVSTAGYYRVQTISSDGYRSPWSNNVQVVVSNNVMVYIMGNPFIHRGESTTLTARGADTYLWSTGATTESITVSPTETTEYRVTGTSTAGCTGNASIFVTVESDGIDTPSEMQFSVLPNPASSHITVVGEDIVKITVYNILGVEMGTFAPNRQKKVKVSLENYAKGTYVISVTNANSQTGRRTFVVK